ncbi:hypothetical protein RhiirA4_545803 [Rhizophagus irregularis]|uniref:Uncharacterized protein n=1 Tax=Rhizophagus irregularis TaxID=588596 RepID=A0A2I1GUH5_9GLOM|nr:hypothetical protein RhiirA4_545803 [Rhizophagus irregularis]
MSKNTDIMLEKQFIIEFYQEFDDFDFEKRYLQHTYDMLKTKEFQEFTKKTTGTWDVIPEEPLSLPNKSMKSSQKITMSEDNTPPPIQASNAILHFYQPCKCKVPILTREITIPGTQLNMKIVIKIAGIKSPGQRPVIYEILNEFKRMNVRIESIKEDVTTKSNTNAYYVISEQDQVLINALDLFLRRTPPPDVDSHTTMSDNSYISAAESVVTVIYRRMNNSTL